MIDDQLLSMFSRSLLSLERDLPSLGELLVPRVVPSGENAGKAPARGKSKPPLSVSILDVKVSAERALQRWAVAFSKSHPGFSPPPLDAVGQASWLFSHAPDIADMPWAEMCADEIIGQARWVSDIVSPPEEEDAPTPLEVGGVREIAAWSTNLGYRVSYRTVYRWVRIGYLDHELAPDGRVLVRLDDVMDRCRDQVNDDGVTGRLIH